MTKLVKRRTWTQQGFTRLTCWYSDGTKTVAWFDRYGKAWKSCIQ